MNLIDNGNTGSTENESNDNQALAIPAAHSPVPASTDYVVLKQPGEAEIGQLADELAKRFSQAANFYNWLGPSGTPTDGPGWSDSPRRTTIPDLPTEPAERRAMLESIPPHGAAWFDLTALAAIDPKAAVERLHSIRQAALDDIVSGNYAARVVAEEAHDTPWALEHFLVYREAMIAQWQPRGAIELSLIDAIVQAHIVGQRWMRTLVDRMAEQTQGCYPPYTEGEMIQPPRLSDAEALEQATAMVDRFNKLELRTLRQLRDLRRYSPPITIQSADQVNIAGQQINLTEAAK